MPITIADLVRDERTCTVEFAGESCEVTYRPSGYTPEIEERLLSAEERNRRLNGLVELLSEIILEWDVLEDGEPYPVTVEALRKLPSAFLWAVFGAIIDDLQEAAEDRKNSAGGSPRKASKARARRGTR